MCVAAPGRVVSIESPEGRSIPAVVARAGGGAERVDLMMVPHAKVGDYVVVHSGFAITTVEATVAVETIRLFEQAEGYLRPNGPFGT